MIWKSTKAALAAFVVITTSLAFLGAAFTIDTRLPRAQKPSLASLGLFAKSHNDDNGMAKDKGASNPWASAALVAALSASLAVAPLPSFASTAASTTQKYDGFAEYAKENKMEQSDVGCFVSKCGDQTKALFSNPRGIKGVSCLGRCKGEQSCATRCFAEFGSEDLDNWLSCTIEENECVKVPKNVDNSAENVGYDSTVKKFDPTTLIGKWYKTDGLNPNYDLFDCQSNTFQFTDEANKGELDMGIFFRVPRPEEYGGGYWENSLTEHMVVDASFPDMENPTGRNMHTAGKMYGLKFTENWYILGESNGEKDIPPFKLVAYKGHTLQGNYEGAFVYAKESVLPNEAVPAVREAAARAGLNFDDFTRIDNTCPTESKSLNDAAAGTGTSTTDWIDLVIGEGGVIDWVVPGWRGEYKT
ncbi:hypothetical protein HJC23_009239 [Cyclotella cryptica]|uniref:VDE lipocalin domain-containing protein n=1 Tax=Cyclotella cryptica TaxID=29204 RepID=A0ABD3Q7I7_9STRA|eukprot:CCRYP_008503-RA/>CCRYP_008503-RA protein AED:0.09 eAED:0.11 QI:0/0/0/1/1/1/2/0/415